MNGVIGRRGGCDGLEYDDRNGARALATLDHEWTVDREPTEHVAPTIRSIDRQAALRMDLDPPSCDIIRDRASHDVEHASEGDRARGRIEGARRRAEEELRTDPHV